MIVLITISRLATRTGSELFTRDVALGLSSRGHTPIVYAPQRGKLADELIADSISVVDSLASITAAPDVILGQHHLEAMTALATFTQTPSAYFTLGPTPFIESAPSHPRILRYLPVDAACFDRVVNENGIPPDLIEIFPIPVDLDRFKPRGVLPPTPRKALLFSNYATDETHSGIVGRACELADIELDTIGMGAGTAVDEPARMLGEYDLVFAKARCALEAMAVGCAVVLCDATGMGPMVTPANVEALRDLNFGLRALDHDLDAEQLANEVGRYDPAEAGAVRSWIRANASLDSALDRLEQILTEVRRDYDAGQPPDDGAEMAAFAAYLASLRTHIGDLEDQIQNLDVSAERRAEYALSLEASRRESDLKMAEMAEELEALKSRLT